MDAHYLHHDQQSILGTSKLQIWKERFLRKLKSRSFLKALQSYIWKVRFQSKPSRNFLEAFQPYIWKERLPSRLSRSFLEISSFIYGKYDYQASSIVASSEPSIPIWKERFQSKGSVAASSELSSHIYGKNDFKARPQTHLPWRIVFNSLNSQTDRFR